MSSLSNRPVRLELVQGASSAVVQHGAKPGMLRNPQTNMQFRYLDVALVAIQKHRANFQGLPVGASPKCASVDCVEPLLSIVQPVASFCRTCPAAQWVNGRRPVCNEKRTLYMVELTTMTPFDIILPGSNIGLVDALENRLNANIAHHRSTGKLKHSFWNYSMRLLPQQDKAGRNYLLTFDNLRQRRDAGYTELYDQLKELSAPSREFQSIAA